MNTVALTMLVVGAAAFIFRVLRGPSLPDRIVALDGLLSVVVAGVIVGAARIETDLTLTTVLIVSVAGFVGTVALARFVERRGG